MENRIQYISVQDGNMKLSHYFTMILYILLITALATLIMYFRQVYSHFSRYGVKNSTPIPPMGTIWRTVMQLKHAGQDFVDDYNLFPNERFVGQYEFLTPIVLIRDIELIKKITTKDCDHFLDHRTVISAQNDPLYGRNLFTLTGQDWKDMRSTLSPVFTGSKMKMMIPFMIEIGEQMIIALKNKINDSSSKYADLDARDLASRYDNDVITSCAFGLKVDSFNDRDNQFFVMSRNFNTFTLKQQIIVILFASFSNIITKLKVSIFSKEDQKYIRTLVTDTMKDREERNIIRPDLIHLLMEAKKGTLSHENFTVKDADAGYATVEDSSIGKKVNRRNWSEDDLIAQATVFLSAGFNQGAATMSFLLHELAINTDVQDKLFQEIMASEKKTEGKLDYNAIQEMTYMDMVVSELLRLRPGAVGLDRVCTKDLGKPNPEASEDYIEPLHEWRDVSGHNLLGLMYSDIHKWSFPFQHYVLLSRLKIQISPPSRPGVTVKMFERSVQNSRHCFVENAKQQGFLQEPEYEVLQQWFNSTEQHLDISLDLIVYLKTTPEVVWERMMKRGRAEESEVSLEYLTQIHDSYEHWLSSPDVGCEVLTIDADRGLHCVTEDLERYTYKILGGNHTN